MNYSKSCAELMTALCAARLAFPPIPRNREGFSKRSSQRYAYADISAVIDATAPVLAAHGLVLLQSLEDGEGGTLRVVTTLIHASSEQWLASELTVEKPANMQDFGACSTYAKRYAMQSLLNVSGDEDTDAADTAHEATGISPHPLPIGEGMPGAAPLPATNGNTPAPAPSDAVEHPSEAHLAALRTLAIDTCHEEVEAFETRVRRTAGLPAHASLAPKLLCRTLSMPKYMEVYGWYVNLEKQLAKSQRKEASNGPVTPPQTSAQPAPAPTEDPAAVPLPPASSSPAPEPSSDAAAREKLRKEALSWQVNPAEIEHILSHHPLDRARNILWKARRNEPPPTWVEAAD